MSSIPAFIFVLSLGNLLAIGVHAFTWWLRKRARLFIAICGALALLMFLWGIGFLTFAWGDFNLAGGDAVPTPDNWKLQAAIFFTKFALVTYAIVGVIGAIQMRQIPSRWLVASFCFCFEVLFSVVLLSAIELTARKLRYPFGFEWSIRSTPTVVFVLSLLALAFFRPLWLRILDFAQILIFAKSESREM